MGVGSESQIQVAPASLPYGQLDRTTLTEVAMDLGQPCSFAGDVVFWLVATDSDDDPLTYGISGPYAYFFSVNSSTGEVKLASPLDFEVKSGGWGKPGEREWAGWSLEPESWEHSWDFTLTATSSPCCSRLSVPSRSPSL